MQEPVLPVYRHPSQVYTATAQQLAKKKYKNEEKINNEYITGDDPCCKRYANSQYPAMGAISNKLPPFEKGSDLYYIIIIIIINNIR